MSFPIEIRIAKNSEGGVVRELVRESGFAPESLAMLDWTDIEPYWIVAENGKICGCLQVTVSKPIGRLEYLATDDALNFQQKARVVKKLLETGCNMIGQAGVHMLSGTVPFKYKGYKRMLKRRGAVITNQGNVFLKRV